MKASKYNCFTPNLCAVTGDIRDRSFLIAGLTPKSTGRPAATGTAAERTAQTIAYAKPKAQIVIASKAESDRTCSITPRRLVG